MLEKMKISKHSNDRVTLAGYMRYYCPLCGVVYIAKTLEGAMREHSDNTCKKYQKTKAMRERVSMKLTRI